MIFQNWGVTFNEHPEEAREVEETSRDPADAVKSDNVDHILLNDILITINQVSVDK